MGVQTPTLVELILSGDQDALAGYYDGRAPSVHEYCAQVCAADHVEEAVLASFADFLGRVRGAGPDADLDDLLRKSTRTSAASRMRVSKSAPTCRAMPELIAARANGELPHDEGPINEHLEHCRACRQTALQLVAAEDALVRPASRQPSEEVRTAWLMIASRADETASQQGVEASVTPEPPAPEPEPPQPPATPEPPGPPPAPEPPPPAPEPEPPQPPATPEPPGPPPAPEPPPPAPEPEPPQPPATPEPPGPPPAPEPPPPAPEPEPPQPPPAPEPPPAPAPQPPPAPEPPPAPAATQPPPPSRPAEANRVRRRTGGLIGAARRAATRKR